MKAVVYLLSIGVAFLFSCQSESSHWQSLHPNEGLKDFEILNGHAEYSRDGNTITGITTFNSPNTFLATKKKYGDFELKFEVRITEGLNSGIQIRSISDSTIMKGRVHGYQVEIEDSPRGWAAGIYDEARRGWLYPLERNAVGRSAFQKGKWNAYHILAKGDTLQTWVNSIPCANLIDTLTASGLIGLQVHSIGDSLQAGQTIQWRNLKIKTEQVGEKIKDWPRAPLASILPAQSANIDEFILEEGFYIHQLAGEPQVSSPVASAIDEQGNIWVVELPGYMRDIDGSDEDEPDGKIVVLTDLDKDGRMDKRLVFKNKLVAPRALCLAYNGLLYNDGRALYFDDFETGETELVDSFYVQGGNIEHQPNGLYFNIDNWIYSAKSNARYRRVAGSWKKEATTLRGQWGINADLHGRLIYNDNSNGLFGDRVLPNQLLDNPFLRIKENLFNQLCTDNTVYPYQATAVNRGYMKNVLDEDGKLRSLTSSCSPIIYKGSGRLARSAFTCAPEVNLIKRYQRKSSAAFAQAYEQAYAEKEFLISMDESFRPVNIYNNPLGGLLLVDLRKGVIQHRAYMTQYLREKIIERKLDQVVGKGRLYLINESEDNPGNLSLWKKEESLENKVALLASANGAMRLAMQKHLIANKFPGATLAIEKLLTSANDFGKIHALWTLEGLSLMTKVHLETIMENASPEVIYQVLAMLAIYPDFAKDDFYQAAYALRNVEIDLALCRQLPNNAPFKKELSDLINRYKNSPTHAEALVSRDKPIINRGSFPNSIVEEKLAQAFKNAQEGVRVSPAIITHQYSDNRNEGFPAYNKYCASCHGADGIGQPNLAPPILYSEYVEGPSDKLAALILQGLQGPVHVNGERYDLNIMMPGLKHNPEIDDATVAAIIAFVNNAFSKDGRGVSAERVGEIRKKLEGKAEPLTEAEVLGW